MRIRMRAVAATAGLMPACASAMPVSDFLAKADALRAKGVMAMFSHDVTLLKEEAVGATKAWRTQVAPPGAPPNACPPPGPKAMNSDDFLAMLTVVPAPQRATTSVAQAVTAGLNRRYPCTPARKP